MKPRTDFNEEDLMDHMSVVGIFKNEFNEILMMDHVKLQKWMPPIGKVQYGESPSKAFNREMFEELGIRIQKKYFLYQSDPYKFSRNGKEINISFIVYDVKSYRGQITNMEPHKCNSLRWFTIEELERLFEENKDNAALECILKCVKF